MRKNKGSFFGFFGMAVVMGFVLTVWGAALFAQTAADFDTKAAGNGVVITKYKGAGGNVVIPATIGGKAVVGIGEEAFPSNESLASVTIPDGVTGIGRSAFGGCSGLTAISVSSENRQYQDRDGVLFTKDGKTLHSYPAGKGGTAYTIPNGVTSIGASAFGGYTGLASVTIPASVTSIGDNAFYGCKSLKPEVHADIEKRFGKSVFQ
ncbi:MAG: leucine-rich repeat domain-containing protein [Spirochaetaceae bacterium]|jgi:hypothetical protein|nr:leucine-rich repeat domain-containing protein [Spirochaetaceae bacterium]